MTRKRGHGHEAQLRHLLAQEAARIMAEQAIRDFGQAKRKAAARLGVESTRNLPNNREIEAAFEEYLRLFRADSQPSQLRRLREAAVEAMRMFDRFRPRLVGPVLNGTADENSPVNLHLFADTAEEVDLFLMDRQIPYRVDSRTLKLGPDESATFPVYRFVAGDAPIELTVFTERSRRPPLSPVDGRPMQRAALDRVEALLAEAAGA
ncbi:MAG TPA: hypothetical protein VKA64_03100 [Gammaproteobacteria bacterium]|nr:hypothetical protein [Gammaproteobacteria bacterium]